MDKHAARDAIDALQQSDARLSADIASCPPWRHALFGALFFVLIGSTAISSSAQLVAMPFLFVAVILIVRSDRKRMGVFVNGYRRGATLPVSLAFAAVGGGLVFAAVYLRTSDATLAAKAGLAVLSFALATGFSIYWQRIFRLELGQVRS